MIVSIIVIHYAQNEARSQLMQTSINQLIETTKHLRVEIIVVDNGGNLEDSLFLLSLAHRGLIQKYIRNAQNMIFTARNQALKLAIGDHVVVCDNDIGYYEGWLDECLEVLKAHPNEKIYATPIYNVAHWLPKFWSPKTLKVKGKTIRLNSRAGSNCMVWRRKDFEEVGDFLAHRVAGVKWHERAIKLGYLAAVLSTRKVWDMAFREGMDYKTCLPIKETLANGDDIYFNVDEFKKEHSEFEYL